MYAYPHMKPCEGFGCKTLIPKVIERDFCETCQPKEPPITAHTPGPSNGQS